MSDETPRSNDSTVSRREYMRKSVAGGAALNGLNILDDTGAFRTIDFVRNKEGVQLRRDVPKQWYEQTRKAQTQAEQVKESLLDKNPKVVSVGVGRAESSIDGLREQGIEVAVDSRVPDGRASGATPDIPDHAEGIPVNTVEIKGREFQSECYDEDISLGDLPSGTRIHSDQYAGAVGCQVHYDGEDGNDSNGYFLTSRHLFTYDGTNCNYEDVTGSAVYQEGDEGGEVIEHLPDHDAVVIDPNWRYSSTSEIHDHQAEVSGWLTEDAVSYLASKDDDDYTDEDTIHFRGPEHCNDGFVIDGYNNTFTCDYGPTMTDFILFDSSDMTEQGDSGGPFFWNDTNGNAAVAGILSGSREFDCGIWCEDTRCFGPACYAIRDDYDIYPT